MAEGRLVVVICTFASTVSVSDCVAVCGVEDESLTPSEKAFAPEVIGVPEIAPVDAFKLNPCGSEPDETLHV